MGPLLLTVFAALGVGLFFLIRQRRRSDTPVSIRQMRAVATKLRGTGHDQAFAVFRFAPAVELANENTMVDLQFAMDGGRLGLEWVLVSPRNRADRDRIAAFMRQNGHTVDVQQMNGVEFLRVEDGDVIALGQDIMREVYGLEDSATVSLIADGFEWK